MSTKKLTVHVWQPISAKWPYTVDPSMYNQKVLGFLHLTSIPYTIAPVSNLFPWNRKKWGNRGKMPWIEHNNQIIDDSDTIINYLKQNRHYFDNFCDPDEWLNEKQLKEAHAYSSLCDSLYFVIIYQRFINKQNREIFTDALLTQWENRTLLNSLKMNMVRFGMKRDYGWTLYLQGYGRFDDAKIYEIGRKHIASIAGYLDDKQFFMGDKISTIDCTIWAFMNGVYDSPFEYVGELPDVDKIKSYCRRVEDRIDLHPKLVTQ
eukprot:430233_1